MIDNVEVGKTIARLRQNKNMTQKQLAAALSVSHQAVSKWETGAALPDVQTLVALTRLFGITIEQLLEGDVLEDRVETPKPASPFEEPIQNIGNFVNNIMDSLFRPQKEAAEAQDDGAEDADISKPAEEGDAAADEEIRQWCAVAHVLHDLRRATRPRKEPEAAGVRKAVEHLAAVGVWADSCARVALVKVEAGLVPRAHVNEELARALRYLD